MDWLHVVLAVLATWRLTHLLSQEDGPWDLVVRLRRVLGDSVFGRMLDCFYCLSVWVAAPLALVVASGWSDRILTWLALSGGACLLERATAPSPPAPWVEAEVSDVVLRPESSGPPAAVPDDPLPSADGAGPDAGRL